MPALLHGKAHTQSRQFRFLFIIECKKSSFVFVESQRIISAKQYRHSGISTVISSDIMLHDPLLSGHVCKLKHTRDVAFINMGLLAPSPNSEGLTFGCLN